MSAGAGLPRTLLVPASFPTVGSFGTFVLKSLDECVIANSLREK